METTDRSDNKLDTRRRPGRGSRLAIGLVLALAALAIVTAASPAPGSVRTLLAARATDQPYLDSYPSSTALGANGDLDLLLHVPGMSAAKVALFVPTGYTLRIDQPSGSDLGLSFGWSGSLGTLGDITASDPSQYTGDPAAQACAPGPHAAVWLFQLHALGQPEATVPIFVDPTTGAEAALGAYELQFCLAQPATSSLGLDGLEFSLDSALTNPNTQGAYDWRAIVTPAASDGATDPSAAYELRSLAPLPARLAISARYDRHIRRAIVSGRFIAPATSVNRMPVSLYAKPSTDSHYRYQTWTRTNANGAFTFRRRISTATRYYVEIEAIGSCSTASTAPAGCRNETLTTISSTVVRVRKK